MNLRGPQPPDRFEDLVQWHADEIAFLFASMGETPDYQGLAGHIREQLARGDASALKPRDPSLWRAVVQELFRREAGVVTDENRAWFEGLEG